MQSPPRMPLITTRIANKRRAKLERTTVGDGSMWEVAQYAKWSGRLCFVCCGVRATCFRDNAGLRSDFSPSNRTSIRIFGNGLTRTISFGYLKPPHLCLGLWKWHIFEIKRPHLWLDLWKRHRIFEIGSLDRPHLWLDFGNGTESLRFRNRRTSLGNKKIF